MSENNVTPILKNPDNEAMRILETLAGKNSVYVARIEEWNGTEIVYTEHSILIRQVRTGDIPKLIKASGSLLLLLAQPKEEAYNIPHMIMVYPEEALDVLATLIKKDRTFVDLLETDDTIALMSMVLEANFDFFVQRLLPKLSGAVKALTSQLQTKGINLQNLAGQMQPKP